MLSLIINTCKKNKSYSLLSSRDTDDQRILESDKMKVKTGHIQPKAAVSDANFLWLSPHKKSKKLVE